MHLKSVFFLHGFIAPCYSYTQYAPQISFFSSWFYSTLLLLHTICTSKQFFSSWFYSTLLLLHTICTSNKFFFLHGFIAPCYSYTQYAPQNSSYSALLQYLDTGIMKTFDDSAIHFLQCLSFFLGSPGVNNV